MASQSGGNSGGLSMGSLAVTLAALLGITGIIVPAVVPLESQRPRASGMLWVEGGKASESPARLWQDPIPAVYRELPTSEPARSEFLKRALKPEQFTEMLRSRAPAPGSPARLLLMPVIINGDAWPDSEESRLTSRTAVLSAMREQGLVPEQRQAIRYFHLPTGDGSAVTLIPFEFFSRDAAATSTAAAARRAAVAPDAPAPYGTVVVLWIRSDHLPGNLRMAWFDSLLRGLDLVCEPDGTSFAVAPPPERAILPPTPPFIGVTILGPTDSNMLVDMVAEDAVFAPAGLKGVTWLAHSTTVDCDKLVGASVLKAGALTTIAQAVGVTPENWWTSPEKINAYLDRYNKPSPRYSLRCGGFLRRTIGTDGELAQLLAAELRQRRADPISGARHLVLLHEWDTVYGRSLPRSIESEIGAIAQADGAPDDWKARVHRLPYLRGLDGVIPGQEDAREQVGMSDAPPSGSQSGSSRAADLAERPAGRGQVDYIRRLVDRLHDQDAQWRLTGDGRLGAIGVFGSDIYDKLLLFRALRAQFPDVVLFTTDLNARLLHSSVYNSMRNVVIASHYDLVPPQSGAAEAVPFRTGYQTAIFLATGQAVTSAYPLETPPARLYEVGRSGAVPLFSPAGIPRAEAPRGPIELLREYGVGHRTWLHWFAAAALLFVLAYVARWAVLQLSHRAMTGSLTPWLTSHRFVILAAGTVVLISLAVLAWAVSRPGEEPFGIVDGVSAWPGILLRCLIVASSVWLAWRVANMTRVAALRIQRRHKLDKPPAEQPGRGEIDSYSAWADYRNRPFPLFSPLFRAGMVGFAAFTLFIFMWNGWPASPVRGDVSYWADRVSLCAMLLAVAGVVLFVLDETWSCARFVERLRHGDSNWVMAAGPASFSEIDARLARSADRAWLDVKVIAELTGQVAKAMYYPFGIMLLVMVAYHPRIDIWSPGFSLLLPLVMCAALALVGARWLRRAAETARDTELDRLARYLRPDNAPAAMAEFEAKPSPGLDSGGEPLLPLGGIIGVSGATVIGTVADSDVAAATVVGRPLTVHGAPSTPGALHVQETIREIKEIREGAFGSLFSNPALQALSIPLGGFGVMQLVEVVQRVAG